MASIKSDAIADTKEHLEQPGHYEEVPPLPESLAGLTQDELAKVEKRAILKLDLVIMPAITILYILNYLDRQNLAASKLANIEEDLGLTTQQFNTAISILFVGYILMQVPSNLLVSKIKWPMIYINGAVLIWGAISACTAAVQSFGGLIACRFMLGFVEAAFFPGALFYLSMFYDRQRFAFRTAIMYSGSQWGSAFGNLLAIGILELDGVHGLSGWRWLFIVEGVITIGVAIIFAIYMPNTIDKIWNLNQQQADFVRWNFQKDQKQQDHSDEISAFKGFMMAVKDPKTWMFCATLYATYTAAAVNNFFPTVVGGLGFSRNASYGMTAPPFVLSALLMLVNGFHSDRVCVLPGNKSKFSPLTETQKPERFLHVMVPLIITAIANIIAVSTLNVGARYFAMMLMPVSFYSSAVVQLSWISGSLSQPKVKRGAAIALINCLCNTPNIWTAYTYYDSPRYLAAFLVNLAASVIAIVMACVTFFYLRGQNRRMDQGKVLGKSGPTAVQQASGFRYIL